jgi:hypothetical protein
MNWAFISQKTAFFIATAVKTSHLTQLCLYLAVTSTHVSLSRTDSDGVQFDWYNLNDNIIVFVVYSEL